MFAELTVDTTVTLAVIGLIYMAIQEWFAWKRAQIVQTKLVEQQENVKADLETHAVAIKDELKVAAEKTAARLEKHDAKLDEVAKQTNGMKEELVRVTEQEALARGIKQEKDRPHEPAGHHRRKPETGT
jgi:hypothetical protein